MNKNTAKVSPEIPKPPKAPKYNGASSTVTFFSKRLPYLPDVSSVFLKDHTLWKR